MHYASRIFETKAPDNVLHNKESVSDGQRAVAVRYHLVVTAHFLSLTRT